MTFADSTHDVAHAGLWAASSQLALYKLQRKVRDFVAGVQPHIGSKHGEPKIIGFKDRFDELMVEAAKPLPELLTKEHVRTILENP